MKRQSLKEVGTVVLVLTVAFTIFYFRLLFDIRGFLFFGNFSQTLNLAEVKGFFPFYNPFLNFGSFSSIPLGSLEYSAIEWSLIVFPSVIFGLAIGIKIYILLTSIIFGLSFFCFTSIFTQKFTARIIGTLFFLFNPFTIQLYASGDFSEFIFQSFIFIGLLFFNLAILKMKFFHPLYIISILFLVLSIVVLQAFIAALVFYLVIGSYTILFSMKGIDLKEKILFLLKSISSLAMSGLFLGLIAFLPLLFGPVSYLPGSSSSLPLSTFIGGAVNTFKVITMNAYPPSLAWTSVLTTYGSFFYSIWFVLEILLIIVLFFSYVLTRDRKFIFFPLIVVILALFASETAGPLGNLTVYLYLHVPGYQALNYPYLWVWFLIMPIYSVIIILILDKVAWKEQNSGQNSQGFFRSGKWNRSTLLSKYRTLKNNRAIIYIFLALVVVVLVAPIATEGYYGSGGIKRVNMPAWFNTLDSTLVDLTKKNDSGVIFNTIGSFIQFGNNFTNRAPNLLQAAPQFRTVSISSYIPNYNAVTDFFYWFYYLLYNNETKYSAQILSSIGVQYFVDIYNANSVGYPYFVPWSYNVNASSILSHQQGWEKIVQTNNYTIFKNEYYSGNDYYTSHLSLVLGNYNTLNDMAYLGVNLANTTPIFASDITSLSNYSEILNHTNLVVLSGYNSVYDLILALANSTTFYPVNYVNGELGDASTSWINSERGNNYPYLGSLLPFSETSGNNSLKVPIRVSKSGNYEIFMKLAFSNISSVKGGMMNVISNGKIIGTFNTSKSYQNETNGFLWVKLNAHLSSGKNILTLQSQRGFNAVSQISIINTSNLQSATRITDKFLLKERNNILEIYQPQQIVPTNNTAFYYGSDLGSRYPGGNYLHINGLNGNNTFNLNAPSPLNGALMIEMLSQSNSTFKISYGNNSPDIGISSSLHIPSSEMTAGSVILPVNNSTSFDVKLTNGVGFLGMVAFLPKSLSYVEPPVNHTSLGNLTRKDIYGGISNFTLSENATSNFTILRGSFSYKNVSYYFPVSLSFTGIYNYNMSPVFTSSVIGPGKLSLNDVTIQSDNFSGQPLISPNLNEQYSGQPQFININFVPAFFHSDTSYNVSFCVKFYGFTTFPKNVMSYSPINYLGPQISYTAGGYDMNISRNEVLVVRLPFMDGSVANAQVSPADNGLNTLIFAGKNAVLNKLYTLKVTSYVYKLFWEGLYIGLTYSLVYCFAYCFISFRKKFRSKGKPT